MSVRLTGIIFGVLALVDVVIWALTRSAAKVCVHVSMLRTGSCTPIVRDLHAALGPAALIDAILVIVLLVVSSRKGDLPPCPMCGHQGGAHRCPGPPLTSR